MRKWYTALVAIACAGVLSACNGAPTPSSGDAVLIGFEALPKALATLPRSATPDQGMVQATVAAQTPDISAATPTTTATPTPLRGVFMGDATVLPGTPIFQSGTRAPLVITQVSLATTRQANPGVGIGVPINPPLVGNPPPIIENPSGVCGVAPAAPFARAAADPNIRPRLGCPRSDAISITLVTQPFERGVMFWRDTREIYALTLQGRGAAANTFWKFPDGWTEGQPDRDPSLQPPENLFQPVRGFGAIWRANPAVRDGLGWAVAGEQPYNSLWQPFEGGVMFIGGDGAVYAVLVNDGASTAIGSHFGALPQ